MQDFLAFQKLVFLTVHQALTNPEMGGDILAAVAAITGAVVTSGANPAADLAALQSLNKIVSDLVAAKAQVVASGVQ